MNLAIMRDELVKIAVTVDQLQGLARRMSTIRTKVPLNRKAGLDMLQGDLRQMSGAVGLSAVPGPVQQKARLKGFARDLGESPEGVTAFMRSAEAQKSLQDAKDVGGNILMPRGGMSRQMRTMSATNPEMAGMSTKGMSGAGQKALNLVGVGHEAAELTTPAKYVQPFASHLSPDVLVREHNILSTLKGKGAGEARRYARGLRETSGEAEAMKGLFKKRFGDRGDEFLQEGRKVPKAMRKRFGEWAGSGRMLEDMYS